MEKAFDVKALVAKLDAKGVPLAEEMAKVLVECVLEWTEESVMMTENKIDDVAVAFFPMLKGMIQPALDQIDGKK